MIDQVAEGYRIPEVESWIAEHLEVFTPPFLWSRLEGGHSNLTYKIEDIKGKRAVIRRPPQGQLQPKAHDMGREWALISALSPTSVPVPKAIGLCTDNAVTGSNFYVMEHIEGRPLFTIEDTLAWVPENQRRKTAFSLIDVLADLHCLEPDDIGLGDLGKKKAYVERQLGAWYHSWTSSVEPANFDDARAHSFHKYFLENVPEQSVTRVVHGDYGLHNCLVADDGAVVAVLDWEISTLGDPLVDLAYALNRWTDPDDEIIVDPTNAAMAPGMPTRSELAQRYAERTGFNLDKMNYFRAFNYWKSAAIIHGVYSRYITGQKSAEGVDLALWRDRIDGCLTAAEHLITGPNNGEERVL